MVGNYKNPFVKPASFPTQTAIAEVFKMDNKQDRKRKRIIRKIRFGIFCALMAIAGAWVCGLIAGSSPKEWVDLCATVSGVIWIALWIIVAIGYLDFDPDGD